MTERGDNRRPQWACLQDQPSFAAFHEVVSSFTRSTGFAKGLYTSEELAGGQHTTEAKRLYISKIIGLVGVSMGEAIEPQPVVNAVLLPGASTRPLNDFLISLAEVAKAGLTADVVAAPARPSARGVAAKPTATARRSSDAPACSDAGDTAWKCAHCGHAHEHSLPYCELCAKVRSAAKGGSAAAREGPVRLNKTPDDRGDPRRPPPPSSTASRPNSARSSTSSLHSVRAASGSSGSFSGSSSGGSRGGGARSTSARGSTRGSGSLRVPGYGPSHSHNVRRPARRPEPEGEPDCDLGEQEEEEECAWYDGRWRNYKSEQKKREEARREAEEAHARRRAEAAAEKARLGKGEPPAANEADTKAAAAADEAAWERFSQSGRDSPISVADVPWPQLQAATLGLDPARANGAERKQAFRMHSLRWHPDKFLQVFGARLDAAEREEILKRVTEVSQEINALYQAAEGGAR